MCLSTFYEKGTYAQCIRCLALKAVSHFSIHTGLKIRNAQSAHKLTKPKPPEPLAAIAPLAPSTTRPRLR